MHSFALISTILFAASSATSRRACPPLVGGLACSRGSPAVKDSPTMTLCYQLADAQSTPEMEKAYEDQCVALCKAAAANNGGKLPEGW